MDEPFSGAEPRRRGAGSASSAWQRLWGARLVAAVAFLLIIALAAGPAPAQSRPPLPAEVHPGLLFTAADLPLLKERLERQPYATWWATVLARARSAPATFGQERDKARYAKSLAFAYLMTDSLHFAVRAADLMVQMRFPPRGGDLGEPHSEGEVVALYAVAYDLLHDYLAASDPQALAEIRQLLAEEAQRLDEGIRIGSGFLAIRLHQTPHLDNWHLRAYGGLGLAAYALRGHPGLGGRTPQDWAGRAYDLVTRTLDYQIEDEDGGYAEGPFYLRYAADVYLPYLFALKRLQGIDLFADPQVRKAHDWSVDIRLPSGRRPNIDDAHLDDFYGHYLAAVDEDGGAHRWDWENDSAGLYGREFSEMDAIALYDDRVVAHPPRRHPTRFMPGAGEAVFRSDWSPQATYLLLRGEHGPARERGLAHEHPDETSFILYAGGEMLAVDAGYIDFASHGKVNQGRHHSLVLVDGQGPPLKEAFGQVFGGGEEAYIEDFFTSPGLDYAEVRAAYAGVEIRRRVIFPGRAYFIVADEVRGQAEHHYEWRLHGNGGGTSGGTYERTGNLARWTRPQAELLVFLPERAGRSFAERDTLHSFDYLQELTHTALRVEQQGRDAEFLAVLYPSPTGRVQPAFATLEAGGAEAVQIFGEGVLEVAWLQGAAGDSVLLETDEGRLESDGRFGYVHYPEMGLQGFAVQDGRFLRSGGEERFRADAEVDVCLELDGKGGIAGFARGPDSGYRLFLPAVGRLEEVRFGGTLTEASLAEGTLTLALAGEGELRVQLGPEGGGADFDGDGEVDFADFFLFADVFGQPAERELARFDLNGDGEVGFADFFLFADVFGRHGSISQIFR